jgi:hypothetical protein
MVETLADGLLEELKRNRELLSQFEAIGAPGMIGASMIRQDIEYAEKAMVEGDTIAMIQVYKTLKENQG